MTRTWTAHYFVAAARAAAGASARYTPELLWARDLHNKLRTEVSWRTYSHGTFLTMLRDPMAALFAQDCREPEQPVFRWRGYVYR